MNLKKTNGVRNGEPFFNLIAQKNNQTNSSREN